MKKFLSVFLCVLMLASVAIIPAAAEGEELAATFYFVANGESSLPGNVFAPSVGYTETVIGLNTVDLPEDYGYNVSLSTDTSLTTIPAGLYCGNGEILGTNYAERGVTPRNYIPLLTIPADLEQGTYIATFILDQFNYDGVNDPQPAGSFTITVTIKIPCDHKNAEYKGGTSSTLFKTGFTGVKYCPDCGKVVDLGKVTTSVFDASFIGQLFQGFSLFGQSLIDTITGLFNFMLP